MHFSYMNLLWVMMTNICTLLNMWGHHSRDQYAYILIALWKMGKLKFWNNCHHIHTMICISHHASWNTFINNICSTLYFANVSKESWNEHLAQCLQPKYIYGNSNPWKYKYFGQKNFEFLSYVFVRFLNLRPHKEKMFFNQNFFSNAWMNIMACIFVCVHSMTPRLH